MSLNRWMYGDLPCVIYSGGSVSVYCQKLASFSLNARTYVYIHAHQTNHNGLAFYYKFYASLSET